MNELLPPGIIDTPDALLDVSGEGSFRERLWRELERSSSSDVSNGMLKALPWYPSLFVRFLDAFPQLRDVAVANVKRPSHAVAIVAVRPSCYREMSDLIFQDMEAIEQLFVLSTRESYRQWVPASDDLINNWLIRDPQRWLRAIKLFQPNGWPEANRQAQMAASDNWQSNAAWAFFRLCQTEVPEDAPLSAEWMSALKGDEEYAYLAMRILRDRAASPLVWSGLLACIRSPRWAFHCLRDRLVVDEACEMRFITILESDPAWLVEWMALSDLSIDEAKTYYRRCAKAAAQHELMERMHCWFRTVSTAIRLREVGEFSRSPA